MLDAPFPLDERNRVRALNRYRVLDTPPEEAFDRITGMASRLLNVPIALVSLIDEDRQWFKSRVGLDVAETPRKLAFCAHAIVSNDLLVIEDATQDPRFSGNPLVTGAPSIRFYAGAPLTTEDGHNLGTLCVIDMKPRSITSEEKNHLVELSKIVVNELELRIARDKAEATVRSMSEFLAHMSEEIRAPMADISEMLSILSKTELTDLQSDILRSIQSSSVGLMPSLNDILDRSQIESGAIDINHTPFNIADAITDVTDVFSAEAFKKGNTITAKIAPDVPTSLVGDPLRVRQVLTNLVSNSNKFTFQGHISINCSVTKSSSIKVSVKDTGIGIPDESKEFIFTDFMNTDMAVSRGPGSTGLGLSISKSLVELMGGRISFASMMGQGAEFWFTLPLEVTKTGSELMAAADSRGLAEQLHILVVEDNIANQQVVAAFLDDIGHTYTVVNNGTAAVEEFRANSYDLVLLDIWMPGMNGFQTLAAFSETETPNRSTPVIALTADVTDDRWQSDGLGGFDGVVHKPIMLDTFVDAINEAVSNSRSKPGPDG